MASGIGTKIRQPWRSFLAKTKWFRITTKYELHRRALSNRASRRRFRRSEPVLDDLQRRLVADLRRDGIAMTSFEELLGDRELWSALEGDIKAFAEEAAPDVGGGDGGPTDKSDYYISRWAARHRGSLRREVSTDDPWARLGLSSRMLDVVNAYRGLWTKLLSVDNVYTVPFPGTDQRVGAQNWHRDPEDLHVVKVFLYFSDVDDEAGPFQYIQGSVTGARYGDAWPWRVRGGTYPPAGELEKLVSQSDLITAEGRAGTIIFCDTSGWHRGGFAKSRPRTMSIHTYVSPASVAAERTKPQLIVDGSTNGRLSDVARFAVPDSSKRAA
jgi:hypothetical protein